MGCSIKYYTPLTDDVGVESTAVVVVPVVWYILFFIYLLVGQYNFEWALLRG